MAWLLLIKWLSGIISWMVLFYGTKLWKIISLQLLCIVCCKHSCFNLLDLSDLCDNQTAKCHEWESPPQQQYSRDSLGSAGVELFSCCLLYCLIFCFLSSLLHNSIYCATYSWPSNPVFHLLHLCETRRYRQFEPFRLLPGWWWQRQLPNKVHPQEKRAWSHWCAACR